MTNADPQRPIVPEAREGHRRLFSEKDKRRIIEEATGFDKLGANIRLAACWAHARRKFY